MATGMGQLTLVEHALCPLDSRASLVENLVHSAVFLFTDTTGRRRQGRAQVFCPAGLSPIDEFYLWGLLAIALSEPDANAEFHATPHYCLRRLGVIDQFARRGGRQYRQFTQSIERLSLVRYRNDRFYDPVRGEHRRVTFGLFSYSLPLDPKSCRAWRFAWDPVFFSLAQAAGGHLRFDLSVYRELDPASRRMFLFACKLFYRQTTARIDLATLGVEVLGLAPTMAIRNLKAKVGVCGQRLADAGILSDYHCERTRKGRYAVILKRGKKLGRRPPDGIRAAVNQCAVADPLRAIGFDERAIGRLVQEYSTNLLQEWADITLAAGERHGRHFFKRSPQAYFIDNIRNAAAGRRTPPDWWHDLRKSERQAVHRTGRTGEQTVPTSAGEILQSAAGDNISSTDEAVRALFRRQN